MLSSLLSRLIRIRLTAMYAAVLATIAAALVFLGPKAQDQTVREASTNLDNLRHGHLGTLLGSALVTDASGPVYLWLPGLVCLLALAELLWHSGRLALVFITGHIGASLLVAAGLAVAIRCGWLPWSLAFARDVGMSYGAAAVLGALTAAIPGRWRPAWIGWWVSVAVGTSVLCIEFTDIGHVVALALGMLAALGLGGSVRWTSVRCLLLAVASVFGFGVLAHTGSSVLAGLGLGAVGAIAADWVARQWRLRRSAATVIAEEPVPAA